MTVQIAIALGYSNLNLPTLQRLLLRHFLPCLFRLERRFEPDRDMAYDFAEGKAYAEILAVTLAGHHPDVPLCVGVVAVRLCPSCPDFQPCNMEIAVCIERGDLKEPITLTPHTTHNAACAPWGRHPHESYFDTEGCLTLLEAIRVKHRSLHLV